MEPLSDSLTAALEQLKAPMTPEDLRTFCARLDAIMDVLEAMQQTISKAVSNLEDLKCQVEHHYPEEVGEEYSLSSE